MDTTGSTPTTGQTTKKNAAIRIGAAALVITAGLTILGIAGVGTVAADEPAPSVPAVQYGARPMQAQ